MELPFNLVYGGAAYLNGEIYVFGGNKLQRKAYKLTQQMKWEQVADMTEVRYCEYGSGPSSLSFEGSIWVFGGCNSSSDESALNSVEKYVPAENRWIKMPLVIANGSIF